jgi:hypothetical protein
MWKKVVILAVATMLSLSAFPFRQATRAQGETTTVSVEPQSTFGLIAGNTFLINITVSNVVDLFAWEFHLYYENAVLNGTTRFNPTPPPGSWDPAIDPGPFLGPQDSYFWTVTAFTDNYNATHGVMYVGATLIGNVSGVSGSGTLATINFTTVGSGHSVLDLDDTKLIDSNIETIPHTTIDGEAYVGAVDIAISEIDTLANIPKGSMAHINVTSQNRGQFPETFDVTLSYDGNPIDGTKTVLNLPGGGSQILNFTWDTTPIPIGEYGLTATATTVPGETDLSDNNITLKVYVGTRDLTATAVKPYRTAIPIGFDKGVDVLVTVKNNGQATETFNVTLSQGSIEIGNQTTALISGGSGNLTFTWNTSILQYGNYSLNGSAVPLPYETHTSDNNLTKYAVVTIPGDTNGDMTVDIYDAIVLAAAYEANSSSPSWNPNADINGDNIIDIYDAITLSSHYGQSI